MMTGYLISLGGFLALLFSAAQFVSPGRRDGKYLAAFAFFDLSVWLFYQGLFESPYGLFTHADPGFIFSFSFIAAISYAFTGPLMYFLMSYIYDVNYQFKKKQLLMFLPGLIVAGFFIYFSVLNLFVRKKYFSVIDELAVASFYISSLINLVFWIFIIFKVKFVYSANFSHKYHSSLALIPFMAFITVMIAGAGGLEVANLLIFIILVYSYFLAVRYPDFTSFLRTEAAKVKYSKSLLEKEDTNTLIEEVAGLMEEKEFFRKPDLKLEDMAEQLQISSHQLSELLNVHFQEPFFSFINRYRIRKALELLDSDKDYTVSEIVYESGFNSSSAFYRAFTKQTGLAPGEYKKNKKKVSHFIKQDD
jgi:AraC-like DNA-binding protein